MTPLRKMGRVLYVVTKPLLAVLAPRGPRVRVEIRRGDEVLLVKSWFSNQEWSLPGQIPQRLSKRSLQFPIRIIATGLGTADLQITDYFTHRDHFGVCHENLMNASDVDDATSAFCLRKTKGRIENRIGILEVDVIQVRQRRLKKLHVIPDNLPIAVRVAMANVDAVANASGRVRVLVMIGQ